MISVVISVIPVISVNRLTLIEVVPGIFAQKRRIQFRSFGSDL